jgi:hypothetical protein
MNRLLCFCLMTALALSVGCQSTAPKAEDSQHSGAIYRWAVWSSYGAGWFADNNSDLFGGVSPSWWGDGGGRADHMSADKEELRTLFTRKGYAGKNATVVADKWKSFDSTDSRHAAALFRIRNTTTTPIPWSVSRHHTANAEWGELASVSLNGVSVWCSDFGKALGTTVTFTQTLSIPPGRTSTVIFISGSTSPPPNEMRALFLAFFNDSLELPPGLEYVDDLDTATGGWEQ